MKFYAIDYVGESDCELVINGELYTTEEAATAAKIQKYNTPEYEVNWYTWPDLEEIFDDTNDLHILL